MLGYATIGTNDLEKARAFYGPIFQEFGAASVMDNERMSLYAAAGGMIAICTPYDEQPATVGNGMMIGLSAADHDQVKAVYDKAMSLGATDEGEPGPRGDGGAFYGAYFRDLDGNKICVFKFG